MQREVERILADPAFRRAPVQSRLLDYLCEQTLARKHSISQLAVAVDGLGRHGDACPPAESYPRVQISRLRRNLSLYYARRAPGEGLAVYIPYGDYRLRLASPAKAYGERRAAFRPPANDTAGAAPWNRPALVTAALVALAALYGLWLTTS